MGGGDTWVVFINILIGVHIVYRPRPTCKSKVIVHKNRKEIDCIKSVCFQLSH